MLWWEHMKQHWKSTNRFGRVQKNRWFWTVVLEKTLERSLTMWQCMAIRPVHPKGKQHWILIERTDSEAEAPVLWPPDSNICWIIKKTREFQKKKKTTTKKKNIYFCFINNVKDFDCVDHNKLENSWRDGNTRPPDLLLEKSVFRLGSNS